LNQPFTPNATDQQFFFRRKNMPEQKTSEEQRIKTQEAGRKRRGSFSQQERQASQMKSSENDNSFVNLKSQIIRNNKSRSKSRQGLIQGSVMSRSSANPVQYDYNGRITKQKERDHEVEAKA